jgi:hypothetical protein
MCNAVVTGPGFNCTRSVRAVIDPDKFIAACIKSAGVFVDMEHCEVISPLAVFSLMEYRAAKDLCLTDREIPLEIG